MSAFSDRIQARYTARESETDDFGRVIEVRRLRPGAALRIRALVGTEVSSIETEALIAASVCALTEPGGKKLDWDPPRNEIEVYGRIDVLETEGMQAAIRAYARLFGETAPGGGKNAPAEPDADGDDRGAPAGTLADGLPVPDAVTQHQDPAAEPLGATGTGG